MRAIQTEAGDWDPSPEKEDCGRVRRTKEIQVTWAGKIASKVPELEKGVGKQAENGDSFSGQGFQEPK